MSAGAARDVLAVIGALWLLGLLALILGVAVVAFRARRAGRPFADEMQEQHVKPCPDEWK
jgi:cytochrome c-type biogenesis protein CcmH/NrfF